MRAAGILAGAALAAMAAAGVAQTAPTDRKAIEARFDQHISSADQLAWLKDMSSAPNHVGSPHDKANAEAILARFRQ